MYVCKKEKEKERKNERKKERKKSYVHIDRLGPLPDAGG